VYRRYIATLEQNAIDVITIPANCTDRLQPLDISTNKAAKSFMQGQFQSWYAQQVQLQMKDGGTTNEAVDLWMSIVKSISARWLVNLYDYLVSKPDIKNGFKGAGITTEFLNS
jgi:hypothetical protein